MKQLWQISYELLKRKVKGSHQAAMAAGHTPVGSPTQELLKAKHEAPPALIGVGLGRGLVLFICDSIHQSLP